MTIREDYDAEHVVAQARLNDEPSPLVRGQIRQQWELWCRERGLDRRPLRMSAGSIVRHDQVARAIVSMGHAIAGKDSPG